MTEPNRADKAADKAEAQVEQGNSELPAEHDRESSLAYQDSRAAYESLVNSLPLSVLIKDIDGRRLFANRTYLDMRGISLQDLIGKRDVDLFPPEIAEQYSEDDRQVIENREALHSVERTLGKHGESRWIERVKSPIFNHEGEVIGIQLMFWDVTDKVLAEEQLKHERDLLNHLLKHIPDSIYFKDRDSRFLRISEAMAEKFGLPNAAAAEGKTDADIFSEEHAQAARADEVRIMETLEPLVNEIERETWRDRDDTWCMSTKMPLIDDHGEVMGTFGISRDVTKLKKYEDDLRDARDAADRANRAKSDFLANMSHEIRTPMNAIIGMSELLSQTRLSEEQRDYVQMLRDSADSLLGLLNDILDFSKIEARKLELESIPFSVRDLVEKTGRTLSLRAAEKGLELACRVAPDVPSRLIGDPGRLRQIMINLIGNALKFTDEGEVVVDVSLGKRQRGWPAGSLPIHVVVRDTGIGVPDEKQAAILDAFTQADPSTTRRFGGTGLGLAISRQLVELMQGKLQLESRVGYGTKFFFTIPLLEEIAEEEDRQRKLSELEHLPVLVVDDNPTNRRILKEILTTWHFEPELASSGKSALSVLDDAERDGKTFSLAILDCMMPEMDGFELAQKIRERYSSDQTKLIILSSASHSDDFQRCQQIGISRYLTKPVVQSELLESVLQVMGIEQIPEAAVEESLPPCPSLRVLVAEDGIANQHVAVGILRAAGHQAVVACDGREAIARWQNEPFDLILMDMHMPVMDGIQATEHIRAAEAATGKHIPIIALTAAALKDDVDACERAGMDAHLPKPIHPRELQVQLARFAPEQTAASTSDRAQQEEARATPGKPRSDRGTPGANSGKRLSDLLEQSIFRDAGDVVDFRAAASRVPGGLKGVRRLAEVFKPECEGLMETLRAEIPHGDVSSVQRSAHTLKGSANLFMAKRVYDLALRIESKAREKGLEDLHDDLQKLDEEVAALLRVIGKFLELTNEE
jgi:PAS domain S-box-containing protein